MAAVFALSILALAGGVHAAFPDCANGPLANNTVCDATATPIERATALIDLFTLEEKLNNTGNTSPGVPRLGLPAYQWWQEGLHGVASSPGVNFAASGPFSYATSFPEPILMSAAFDDALIHQVGLTVGTEGRAFNNFNRSGLDFWTPNINAFRDPRWGRGQETPGEDTFHLQSYVYNLLTGLEGGVEPQYKQVIATCKHYAGYDIEDWEGNVRYGFDALISLQDLSEFYTPQFKTCARDAVVGSFMCSYNAVNGVPSCANSYFLQTLLREHWNWTSDYQYVTSDCDAVQNIYEPHYYAPTRQQAVADALNAGTDTDCGTYYPEYLPSAYAQGLFNISVLDRALIRQYAGLVKLGYFDPAESVSYRALTWANVSTPGAEELAYTAAVEGITLLKNDGTLPLSPSYKTLALIGPWANATTQMQGNYAGIAPYLHSPLYAAQQLGFTVNYAAGPGVDDPTTSSFPAALAAANASEVIIFAGGIDDTVEAEAMDRYTITYPGVQLDFIDQLSQMGKPLIVLQMGGGQVDDSELLSNPDVNALIWGGYPGQDGGTALMDIIVGNAAPAGRLPVTQYPAEYVYQVPMTDMALRPGPTNPGRTYKWYTGTPVVEFGYGLHYTNFSATLGAEKNCDSYDISTLVEGCLSYSYLDLCPFASFAVNVTNTGSSVTSDYVTLLFLKGEFGPAPYPNKALVAYDRLHAIAPSSSQTTTLNLTLGSLSRVDGYGNAVLYPGSYTLVLDVDSKATLTFELTGLESVIDYWPQP
ncbi:Probable exo-1,4-beta-xylosidase [Sparassis crispa]|uniref:xylan 1,4-beta-xylosidase n=1 Tax=Sparassis crispa TaxID=139825 RepID=A0A401GVX2_9APHY|nr:Probable exo-1,4-beta-xylosidase [Sparassis crispa]GBE86378.1 Probable exo-1,4-beta-xylosidase [Sparassis crispa]